MQDNYSNINKKLVDRGWKEMETILNKEMPAIAPDKPRWKRYFLLLLFLGIGLGATWGILMATNFFNSEETKPSYPIAGNQISNTKQASNGEIITTQKDIKNIEEASLQNVSKTNKGDSNKTIQKGLKRLPQKPLAIKEKAAEFKKSNSKVSIDLIALPTVVPNPEEIASTPSKVSSLPQKELFYFPELHTNTLKIKSKTNSQKVKFASLKASTGEIINPAQFQHGPSFEVLVDLPIKESKFGVQTGINYFKSVSDPFKNENLPSGIYVENTWGISGAFADQEELFLFNAQSSSNSKSYVGIERSYSDTSSISFLSLPLELHYASIPLHLNYKLGEKLMIHGGANLSLLLGGPPNSTGGIFRSNKSEDDLNSVTLSAPTAELLRKNQTPLKKFDISVGLGLAYDLGKSWEAGIQYNFGLIDPLQIKTVNSHNRFVKLSLNYKFFRR